MKKFLTVLLSLLLLTASFNEANTFVVVADDEETTIVEEENIHEDQDTVEEYTETDINQQSEESYETFILNDYRIIDDIKISVEGTFDQKVYLSVKKVYLQNTLSENTVVSSYTFDIKATNVEGTEIQPVEPIKVSFEFVQIDSNLDIEVFHEEEPLDVTVEDNTATVETNGFSLYTVEFTYKNKQFVLEGDSFVRLDDIISSVELSGNIESYEVSNSELFNIFKGDEDGVEYKEEYDDKGELLEYYPINKENGTILYMVALKPFTSEEWLKVTIDGVEYEITVTDAIRVDENGDQVGTNVRFMQTYGNNDDSTRYVSITDNRVIQGPLEDNFTASMPLAEIYIDDTIVNQTLWSKDEYNGTRVIGELLVDNTQGKYAGFQINTDTSAISTDKGSLQNSYGGVWYDFTKRYLNDTQTLTVSGSSANNYELFSGDIVRYTLKGMATKFDVASNAYKNYDVVITYSDILITLCQNSGTGSVNQANISSILKLIDTNMVNFTWSGGFRAGLSYNVNVKVVDPDTGALISGSYYYPMVDIDVGRTGIGGFANLYNAANVNRYSEQVALMNNYGRPTSSGSWEQAVWIPGGKYSAAPFTNKANVTEDNYPYTCNITSKTIDGQANTLLISPGGTTTAVSGKIKTASGVDKDNTFYSGFITLANNTAGGINVKGYASAPTSGGVESYVLTGSQIVNHKVDASSDVGGTIFTTTTGNADGSLSGGTLLGYNEVNKPFEISAATGQSVTYTMTPKGGYKLKGIYIKDGDIDIMTIVNNAKATVNENDYDTDGDGQLDENERSAYEAAVQTAVNTALANDTNTYSISISSLTYLGKGVYAYTFNGIQEDKSIHIEWEKTDLTVTKEMDPVTLTTSDKFKFQIKLSDTSTQETTWRVRAKKNTGKLTYMNPYLNHIGETYYMSYHEGQTETVPYKYVVVSDTTDKNPSEEGWYVYIDGAYIRSYDTTADPDTVYYEIDDTQTSTITNYNHHILGWDETTQTWEDKVIPATSSLSSDIILGTENLDTELSDLYRFVYDGTYAHNIDSYDSTTETYPDYLMWVHDDTINEDVLVVGNTDIYPNGTPFSMGDYFAYVFRDNVTDYSGKIIKTGYGNITIDGNQYSPNFGGYGLQYSQDENAPIYYNLMNNPNGYTLDSGYTHVEGESGLYIITLPVGQNPNTADLTADGWDVTISRVGAIDDDFDLEQAMINAGAKVVQGAVNTYEFEIGAGDTIDFNGVVPMGYKYEITEIIPANSRWKLETRSSNAVVNDFDGEEDVTFTNTEKTFDVTIEKQTQNNEPGVFDFTIEIYKEKVTPGQNQTISLQAYKNSIDSNPTYKLTNNGNPIEISINGVSATIPTGEYFREDNSPLDLVIDELLSMNRSADATIDMNQESGQISTSTEKSIADQVQEAIDGGNTSFSFEPVGFILSTPDIIDKMPYSPATVPDGFNGSNGVFTTSLQNGKQAVFTDIPYGHKYQITETLPVGWENESKTNDTGTLTQNDVTSVWVNKLGEYDLTVNKETVNNDTGQFNFRIKAWRKSSKLKLLSSGISINHYSAGSISFNFDLRFPDNGKYTFTTYSPSPLGCEVAFSDSSINEYTYNLDGAIHKLSQVDTEGVYKTVWEANNTFGSGDYSFTMQNTDAVSTSITNDDFRVEIEEDIEYFDFSSIANPVTDDDHDGKADDGIYAFTLSNHGSITALNITYGYTYEVYEVDSRGNRISVGSNIDSTDWKLKSINGNVSALIDKDETVTFINELVHDLTIKKETIGNAEGSFNFRIKFWFENEPVTQSSITVNTNFVHLNTNTPVTLSSDASVYNYYEGELVYELYKGNDINTATLIETSSSLPGEGWTYDSTSNSFSYSFSNIEEGESYIVKAPDGEVKVYIDGSDTIISSPFNWADYVPDNIKNTSLGGTVSFTHEVDVVSSMALPMNGLLNTLSSMFEINKVYADEVNVPTLVRVDGVNYPITSKTVSADSVTFEANGITYVISTDSVKIDDVNKNVMSIDIANNTFELVDGTLYEYNLDTNQLTITANEYTFSLENGQSITIDNLLHGISYEVYELQDDKWILISINGSADNITVSKGAGGTSGVLNGDQTVVFLNEPAESALTVKKIVSGNMGNKFKDFTFEARVGGWKTVLKDAILSSEHIRQNIAEFTKDHTNDIESLRDILGRSPKLRILVNNTIADDVGSDDFDGLVYRNGIIANYNSSTVFAPGYVMFDSGSNMEHFDFQPGDIFELQYYDYLDLSAYGGIPKIDENHDGIADDGWYVFTLSHNDYFEIPDIPYGYSYEVSEADYSSEGYSTHVTSTDTRKTIIDNEEIRTVEGIMKDNTTVVYTNRNNTVVPTKAYSGVLIPVLSLMLVGIGWFYYDYRKEDEEESDE